MFLTDTAFAEAVGRAHGEALGPAGSAATMVVVKGLLDGRWKVEIEAEAELDCTVSLRVSPARARLRLGLRSLARLHVLFQCRHGFADPLRVLLGDQPARETKQPAKLIVHLI